MEYSRITDYLFIGKTPQTDDYEELDQLGIGLVINMRIERSPYPNPAYPEIRLLWVPTIDSPIFPIPISSLIKGANASAEMLALGKSVYVHCAAGVHRGVAMGAAILISQGYRAEEAIRFIKERRNQADPDAWYIRRRIEKFEKVWRDRRGGKLWANPP